MRSPGAKPGDAGADGLDDAGHLVPQHHGLLDAHGAEAAVLVVVQVGAADAAAAHAHQHWCGAGGRGDVLDAQVAGGMDDECLHGAHKVAVTPPST